MNTTMKLLELLFISLTDCQQQHWKEYHPLKSFLVLHLITLLLKSLDVSASQNTRFSNQHKLEYRSLECTFLGYSLNHKGFKCLDPIGKIIISRNVIFYETSFSFSKMKDINNPHTSGDIAEGTQYSSLIILPVVQKVQSHQFNKIILNYIKCLRHLILLMNKNKVCLQLKKHQLTLLLFLLANIVCKADQNLEYTNPRPL